MNPLRWTFRSQCLLAFAVCAGLIGFALYSQLHTGLEPCPLCIFQRIAFGAVAVVFLIAGLHAPAGRGGRRAYGLLALVAAGIGAGIAGRQSGCSTCRPTRCPCAAPV